MVKKTIYVSNTAHKILKHKSDETGMSIRKLVDILTKDYIDEIHIQIGSTTSVRPEQEEVFEL